MKRIKFENNSLIDVHTHSAGIMMTHLIKGHYPYEQDIIDLAKKARESGVDYVVTFPMPTSVYYNIQGLKYRKYVKTGNCDFPFRYENIEILRTIKEFGLNNVLPFLAFSTHSKIKEQKDSIVRLIEEYDVYGLKYHATIERKSVLSAAFMQFAEIARLYDIPILVHTKPDN